MADGESLLQQINYPDQSRADASRGSACDDADRTRPRPRRLDYELSRTTDLPMRYDVKAYAVRHELTAETAIGAGLRMLTIAEPSKQPSSLTTMRYRAHHRSLFDHCESGCRSFPPQGVNKIN